MGVRGGSRFSVRHSCLPAGRQPTPSGVNPWCLAVAESMEQQRNTKPRPPLPERVLHSLVGYYIFHRQQGMALSLLLGFYGMLRTGELLGIRNKDVTVDLHPLPLSPWDTLKAASVLGQLRVSR